MQASDYPVTFPYGATSYPYGTPQYPYHRGDDRFMPDNTPVVVNGKQVGWSGHTGFVTGPHLHIGRFVGGQDTNPKGQGFSLQNPVIVTTVSHDDVNGSYVRLTDGGGVNWVYLHLTLPTVSQGTNLSDYPNYQEQETEEMITQDDIGILRIGHSEIGNWDSASTHAGQYDQQFLDAWNGKPVRDFIWAQWSNGQPHRVNQNVIDALNGQLAALTSADINSKAQIAKIQVNAQELLKQLTASQDELKVAQSALAKPTADTQLLDDTGNVFTRLVARIFKKG